MAETKRKIFYSFHFDNDVMRVQQVRQMGVIEGNTEVTPNKWEEVKNAGRKAIESWIDDTMKTRSCVVVLIGTETHEREWVKYEIQKAWNDGKGLFGIHIHNLDCPNGGKCDKGKNPLSQFKFTLNGDVVVPKTYDPPDTKDKSAYNYIKENLAKWVEDAIAQRAGT